MVLFLTVAERPPLSAIVPVLDEEPNLPELHRRLREARPGEAEIVFVDDGSRDGSLAVLRRISAGDRGVRAATRIPAKDVGIAAALARRLGAPATFAETAARAFAAAVEAGFGEEDDAAMLRYFTGDATDARKA